MNSKEFSLEIEKIVQTKIMKQCDSCLINLNACHIQTQTILIQIKLKKEEVLICQI